MIIYLMLNHSRRHEKKRVNGLDTDSDAMNVGYGGEQIIQRPTLIKSIDEVKTLTIEIHSSFKYSISIHIPFLFNFIFLYYN